MKGRRGPRAAGAWPGEAGTIPPHPSEDVRRGRATHTPPPFWPRPYHTLPPKKLESRETDDAIGVKNFIELATRNSIGHRVGTIAR